MMEQNGGSDAQFFHDRSRSRDAAPGAPTGSSRGCTRRAGALIQAQLELAPTSIPVTGKHAGAGGAKYPCERAAGAAPCFPPGCVLIDIRPARKNLVQLNT